MHTRVNVTLPAETVRNEAVKDFVRKHGRTQIRRLLKEGAQARAVRDLVLAREWFSVDEQAWHGRRR